MIAASVLNSIPWFITRAAGLTSLALLGLLGLSGIMQATGLIYRWLSPLGAWALHRALGISLALTISIHLGALLFDNFHPFTFITLLVPFASDLKPVTIGGVNLGSLWVSIGILSLYLFVPLILSSLYWVEKKHHFWKQLHFVGYLIFGLVLIHGLNLGTDSANPIIHSMYRVLIVLLGVGILHRLTRVGAVKNGLFKDRWLR